MLTPRQQAWAIALLATLSLLTVRPATAEVQLPAGRSSGNWVTLVDPVDSVVLAPQPAAETTWSVSDLPPLLSPSAEKGLPSPPEMERQAAAAASQGQPAPVPSPEAHARINQMQPRSPASSPPSSTLPSSPSLPPRLSLSPPAPLPSHPALRPSPNAAPAGQPEPCSMLEVLQAQTNTTFFIQAVQAAGMTGLLNDPSLIATIFVPTDTAWGALLAALGWTKDQLFSDGALPQLRMVVQYHIVPRLNLTYGDLVLLPYLARLPTLYNNQPIKVFNKFGSVKVAATSRQIGSLIDPDLTSCSQSAIAHMIDVVLPPDPTWTDEITPPAPVAAPTLGAPSVPTVQLIGPEDQQNNTPEANDAVVKAFGGSSVP